MRAEVRPGVKSTPEHPCWVWRVWHNSREIAFGICPSEAEAHEQAERAMEARARRLGYHWEIEPRSEGGYER